MRNYVFWSCFILSWGAGTIRWLSISSVKTKGSAGGGGQTSWAIAASAAANAAANAGGSVLEERSMRQRESSSCSTDSIYIISRSDTMAPLITSISSPLIMPVNSYDYTERQN